MGQAQTSGNLIAFPRADLRASLGAAMKRHRLPEDLGHSLVREAANFPEVSADAALAYALAQRLTPAPIDFEKARGILRKFVAERFVFTPNPAGGYLFKGEGDLGLLLQMASPTGFEPVFWP